MLRVLREGRAHAGDKMRKFTVLALTALLLGSAAWAGPATPKSLDEEIALIREALKNADQKKWDDVAKELLVATNSQFFQNINDFGRYKAIQFLSVASYNIKDFKTAFSAARTASELPEADGTDWYRRAWVASYIDEKPDAAQSLATLAKRWPKMAADIDFSFVRYVYRSISKADNAEQLQADLGRALLSAEWQPKDIPPQQADFIWFNLAQHDLNLSNYDDAEKAADRIQSSYFLRIMHANKSFDSIIAARPSHFDFDKAHQEEIKNGFKRIGENSDLLEPVVTTALNLIEVDRPTEALLILDKAIAKTQKKGTPAFKDIDDEINWLYDARANALLALGHNEEAIAALKKGARENEHGDSNVSQIINLAETHLDLDDPQEALTELATLKGEVSEYGRMQVEAIRACAYITLKDDMNFQKSRDYIDAHPNDDIGAVLRTHFCVKDFDGAAKFMIAGISDPKQRSNVIMKLQLYRIAAKATSTKYNHNLEAGYAALRERSDVKQALEPYGRIITMNVTR
jgi:hypothetical protein